MSMDYKDVLAKVGWPTEILTLDFEAYWDQEYSLAKQKWSTIEYVASDQFEATGLSIRFRDCTIFIDPDHIQIRLDQLKELLGDNLENAVVVIQNAFFDASVLERHYNLRPKYILDTKQIDSDWISVGYEKAAQI